MAQHAAVPERPHAVVLLAHQAQRRVDLTGVDGGEQRRKDAAIDQCDGRSRERRPRRERERAGGDQAATPAAKEADSTWRGPRRHADLGVPACSALAVSASSASLECPSPPCDGAAARPVRFGDERRFYNRSMPSRRVVLA
jgi:hypothetical protein